MKVELRMTQEEGKPETAEPRALICIAESEDESLMLDAVFGSLVLEPDGFIGRRECECRLADGHGEHYLMIKAKVDPR